MFQDTIYIIIIIYYVLFTITKYNIKIIILSCILLPTTLNAKIFGFNFKHLFGY